MKEKHIIIAARILSVTFTPFYLPIVGLAALFTLSYLSLTPLSYKLTVVLLTYLFTILLPSLLIRLYRHAMGWTRHELSRQERRAIPYLISIACYFLCCHLMGRLHIPSFVAAILISALIVQIVCAMVNVWWKISTHTTAIGGVAGALVAFSQLFLFNPVWWLSLVLILAGMVGSSRMILRQHSLHQVVAGFLIGIPCGYAGFLV